MPTAKPRLNVTLEPEEAQALSDLAELTRLSRSAIVADLVRDAMPVMRRSVAMLKAAQNLTTEALADLKASLGAQEEKARSASAQAFQALAETEAVVQRASRRSAPSGAPAPLVSQPARATRPRPPLSKGGA